MTNKPIKNWEERLESLPAINYNLYLAGTVERKDTGEEWTYEQALTEIKDFIRTVRSEAVEKAKEIVLRNSREEYYGASGFLAASTDKIMFELNALHPKDPITNPREQKQ